MPGFILKEKRLKRIVYVTETSPVSLSLTMAFPQTQVPMPLAYHTNLLCSKLRSCVWRIMEVAKDKIGIRIPNSVYSWTQAKPRIHTGRENLLDRFFPSFFLFIYSFLIQCILTKVSLPSSPPSMPLPFYPALTASPLPFRKEQASKGYHPKPHNKMQ